MRFIFPTVVSLLFAAYLVYLTHENLLGIAFVGFFAGCAICGLADFLLCREPKTLKKRQSF